MKRRAREGQAEGAGDARSLARRRLAERAARLAAKARGIEEREGAKGWAHAVRLCELALHEDPRCTEALVLAAEMQLRYAPNEAAQDALEALRAASASESGSESADYLLALALLAKGEVSQADEHLRKLRFAWRLHSSIFTAGPSLSPINAQDAGAKVFVVDDLAPAAMLESIATHFGPEAPYWSEHRYGESGYFSHAFELGQTPRIGAEALIADHIYAFLRRTVLKPRGLDGKVRFAEWWVHRRDALSGHQMHWDADEHRLQRGRGMHHPLFSTVFYVDVGSGAPTLVTNGVLLSDEESEARSLDRDLVCADDLPASKGWLVHPQKNRLAVFDGRLFHGVIPRVGISSSATSRLTFMVGFWDDQVARTPCDMHAPSANMLAPAAEQRSVWRDAMASWPRDCAPAPGLPGAAARQTMVPSRIPEIWERVSGSAETKILEGGDNLEGGSTSAFVGKFFLHHAGEISQGVASRACPSTELLGEMTHAACDDGAPSLLPADLEFLANWLVNRWEVEAYDELMVMLSAQAHGARALADIFRSATRAAQGSDSHPFKRIRVDDASGAGVLWNLARRGFCVDPELDAAIWKDTAATFEEFVAQEKSTDPDVRAAFLENALEGDVLAGALAFSPFCGHLKVQVLARLLDGLVRAATGDDDDDDDGSASNDGEEHDEEKQAEETLEMLEEIRGAVRHLVGADQLSCSSPEIEQALEILPPEVGPIARATLFALLPSVSTFLKMYTDR